MEKEMIKSNTVINAKIIKRYQNRKLYDTQQSCYVTLEDIAKMIRNQEEVMVVDNKTKNNITAATLTQIIFESEKKASQYAPLGTLKKIIQNENGSMSSFLAKINVFPRSQMSKPASLNSNGFAGHNVQSLSMSEKLSSSDSVKDHLDKRVSKNNTKLNGSQNSLKNATKMISAKQKEDETPDLPKSNFTLTSQP